MLAGGARAGGHQPLCDVQVVNLDCGWSTGFRGADGTLAANATLYPHGMRWLGDQLHAMGLRFGMYGDAGSAQCCSRLLGPVRTFKLRVRSVQRALLTPCM